MRQYFGRYAGIAGVIQARGIGAIADHRRELHRKMPGTLRFDQRLEVTSATRDENDQTGRFTHGYVLHGDTLAGAITRYLRFQRYLIRQTKTAFGLAAS